MNNSQSILVRSVLDVVVARVQVREAARQLGLSLTDQARISMATSSLANSLHLGEPDSYEGRITIECLDNGDRKGVKVVCRRTNNNYPLPSTSSLGNERWMVDEMDLKTITPHTVEVTLTKWA